MALKILILENKSLQDHELPFPTLARLFCMELRQMTKSKTRLEVTSNPRHMCIHARTDTRKDFEFHRDIGPAASHKKGQRWPNGMRASLRPALYPHTQLYTVRSIHKLPGNEISIILLHTSPIFQVLFRLTDKHALVPALKKKYMKSNNILAPTAIKVLLSGLYRYGIAGITIHVLLYCGFGPGKIQCTKSHGN